MCTIICLTSHANFSILNLNTQSPTFSFTDFIYKLLILNHATFTTMLRLTAQTWQPWWWRLRPWRVGPAGCCSAGRPSWPADVPGSAGRTPAARRPGCNTKTHYITHTWHQTPADVCVTHTSPVPDLSVGLGRLHLLPQRRLHLVSQHLTQTVLCVEGVVVVPDRLRNTRQPVTESVCHQVSQLVFQASRRTDIRSSPNIRL